MTFGSGGVILSVEDGAAVSTQNADGASPVLVICDHASRRIPNALGTLGVSEEVLNSHAAWDPGAYQVAFRMAASLDAPLISANFSRLVYDVNRPPSSAQAIRGTSEIYEIPGNRDLSEADRTARIDAIYRPYHDAIDALIEARAIKGWTSILINIHSFTPVYHGKKRQVELGILHDEDSRLADGLLECAGSLTGLKTERNQPYGPRDGVTHTIAIHSMARGLLNAMIEIRNDLIRTVAQQAQFAETLLGMLRCALGRLGIAMEPPVQARIDHASRH